MIEVPAKGDPPTVLLIGAVASYTMLHIVTGAFEEALHLLTVLSSHTLLYFLVEAITPFPELPVDIDTRPIELITANPLLDNGNQRKTVPRLKTRITTCTTEPMKVITHL